MEKPRLVYYNDAHHFHAKRIEPPATLHKLRQPVDEVLGTGVDLLVLGLGYGDVYFHNSKVGRVVGQEKEVWENFIDWRIMRMVQEAAKLGTDQVREVINRGRQHGLTVFPSLKLQDVAPPGGERCGRLRWEHGDAVCLNEQSPDRPNHDTKWAYDFTNELVHQDKLAVAREVLEDYEADGLELDFMFFPLFFRQADTEKGVDVMNKLVADMRALASEVGAKQGREIPIMARIALTEEANLRLGLDAETWLKDKSVDFVVGQEPANLVDTTMPERWLPDVANAAGGAAYYRPPRRIYDERTGKPSIEMFRALGQTLTGHGWSGIYDGYYPWPLDDREYEILREVAYPEAYERKSKRYMLAPREGELGEPTTTPGRDLPAELVEGETVALNIPIADEINSARKDGELRKPELTVRLSFFCVEDDVEFRFNGEVLSWDEAGITDERGLTMATNMAGGMEVQAPMGMSAHWFRWRVDVDLLRQGDNTLEVETKETSKVAGFTRSVNGVEVRTRYREFERPQGLNVDRVEAG